MPPGQRSIEDLLRQYAPDPMLEAQRLSAPAFNPLDDPATQARIAEGREVRDRASVLPLVKTDLGVELGWPQSMVDAYEAIDLPRRAIQGEAYTGDDIANFGLTVGLGGLGASTLARPRGEPGTALGMFLGPAARTADEDALAVAERLAQEGANAWRIWDETGWFQGADGMWRFEIDDSAADLTNMGYDPQAQTSIQTAVRHPELFKAYEDVDPFWGDYDRAPFPGNIAQHNRQTDAISVAPSARDPRSSVLHELQHAVQQREDFGRGGNITTTVEDDLARADNEYLRLWNMVNESPEQKARDDWFNNFSIDNMMGGPNAVRWADYPGDVTPTMRAFDAAGERVKALETQGRTDYHNLAGEVEARNVQTRKDMSPKLRRARPPWTTEDVPRGRQIVHFGGGAQASTPKKGKFMFLPGGIIGANGLYTYGQQEENQTPAYPL